MMFRNIAAVFAVVASATLGVHAQSDYIDAAPATVYEAEEISPQNMDFDAANNMFIAHAGWYKDQLIHYYKFRVFAPPTYPGLIDGDSTSADVPTQSVYVVTDSGDFSGMMGMPIISYHTQDGLNYSDFMSVTFVDAPEGYVAGDFKSMGDVMESGATMTMSDIVMNLPVVPTGSVLQHPIEMGTSTAPIDPLMVYYKGVMVQTFLFEVTDQSAADAFASTRTSATAEGRQTTGFEISVVPTFGTSELITAIPIWHVNQFSNGVVEGENGGGPNPAGMRNVIDADRPDAGYSPLWQLYWATETPISFSADEFSNALQGTADNGFEFLVTPMFVNCPDIGVVGDENTLKAEEFETYIMTDSAEMFYIIGSHGTLVMTGGIDVKLMTNDGTVLGTVQTNIMGGYQFDVASADIPEGTTELQVISGDETIRTIMVDMDDGDMDSAAMQWRSAGVAVGFMGLLSLFL